MTSDDAFDAAVRLLDERGQLMNAHLFRLVESDADLFREVRERLIRTGLAEDRSGVGLARTDSKSLIAAGPGAHRSRNQSAGLIPTDDPSVTSHAEISTLDSEHLTEPEWWLMTRGVTRGPLDLISLCQMRHNGELYSSDVVRHGEAGLWQQLDDIPLLAASKPAEGDQSTSTAAPARRTTSQIADQRTADQTSTVDNSLEADREFNRPGKSWSVDFDSRRNWIKQGWHTAAALIGGTRRLRLLLVAIVAAGAINYWWQLPPPANTVYQEFLNCRKSLQRLQDRRVASPEWIETTQRFRPRIQSLVTRIKPRATGHYPAERALYDAGTLGLLPILDSKGIFVSTDQAFEMHMEAARKALEGRPAG